MRITMDQSCGFNGNMKGKVLSRAWDSSCSTSTVMITMMMAMLMIMKVVVVTVIMLTMQAPFTHQLVYTDLHSLLALIYNGPLYKVKVEMKVPQSCPTLCDPMDYTVHGILQARILEWVDFPFSRGYSQPRNRTWVSCIASGFFTSWATREARPLYRGLLT